MSKKFARPVRPLTGFTLVEIMIVVLIIGVLLNIALPNLVNAREEARAKSCIGNLKQLDSACQQYAMNNKLSSSASLTQAQFTGLAPTYIRTYPACPEGGTYSPGANLNADPTCSIPGSNSSIANYQHAGKWYHGLP